MEGKATLTLTDAKSGRVVKKVTEHNLVTDAVKRILNPPVYAMLYSFNFPNFINNVMPASKLFSGIMLLGNTLSESRENVMLSGDYIPVRPPGESTPEPTSAEERSTLTRATRRRTGTISRGISERTRRTEL